MSYQFTLIVEGPDLQSDAAIDVLFENGCDDALVGRTDGIQYVDFDREAPSLETAILSAIADLERLPDVEVIRLAGEGPMADTTLQVLVTGGRTLLGPGTVVTITRLTPPPIE